MKYRCKNCGNPIEKRNGLCEDCIRDAVLLDRRIQQKTDEEILKEQERKPRSWRDIFYPQKGK